MPTIKTSAEVLAAAQLKADQDLMIKWVAEQVLLADPAEPNNVREAAQRIIGE